MHREFQQILDSGRLKGFIESRDIVLNGGWLEPKSIKNSAEAVAVGLINVNPNNITRIVITDKGKDFFKWLMFNESDNNTTS